MTQRGVSGEFSKPFRVYGPRSPHYIDVYTFQPKVTPSTRFRLVNNDTSRDYDFSYFRGRLLASSCEPRKSHVITCPVVNYCCKHNLQYCNIRNKKLVGTSRASRQTKVQERREVRGTNGRIELLPYTLRTVSIRHDDVRYVHITMSMIVGVEFCGARDKSHCEKSS